MKGVPSLLVLVGPAGSGKSTFANKEAVNGYQKTIIVSRDHIRTMFSSLRPDERLVTSLAFSMINESLAHGYRVIVDNTHLLPEYLTAIQQQYRATVAIDYLPFDVPLATCLAQNKKRRRHVPEFVIRKQCSDMAKLLANYNHLLVSTLPERPARQINSDGIELYTHWPSQRHHTQGLAEVCIWDIDGTLALMKNRCPYDMTRVSEDLPHEDCIKVCNWLGAERTIICTARPEHSREMTEQWLREKGVAYLQLYMRNNGDFRQDAVIKQEFWSDISKRYNIIMLFDDRNTVVEAARKKGFTVAQIAAGNF